MLPFTALESIGAALRGSDVRLGAQNLHAEPKGAFTGEISGSMLAALGCRYVIVGHSERRTLFGEGGPLLSRKLARARESGLIPIYCVGETAPERAAAE